MEQYMIDITEMLGSKKHPVWDRPVPIVKVGKVYHCYLADDIKPPDNYNELCFVLEQAEEDEIVTLHINTDGGYIDSAFKIISSINRSDAFTVGRLTGTVASAGTIISLACADLEVEDYTQLMIHNYSAGAQGKGHELEDYINFKAKDLKQTFNAMYNGFLSQQEINKVIKGKDVWMDASEIRKRWERHCEQRAKK